LEIDLLADAQATEVEIDPESIEILVEPGAGELVILGGGRVRYIAAAGAAGEDRFSYRISDIEGRTSESATVTILLATSPLQNPLRHGDVNTDGNVTPLDALLILSRLARAQREGISGGVPVELLVDQSPRFYYDTDGNGRVEPLDALIVLNRIARDSRQGAGESLEAPLPPGPFPQPEPLQSGDHQAVRRFIDVPLRPRVADVWVAWPGATVDWALEQLDDTADEQASAGADPEPLEHWLDLLASESRAHR
jgi:hypothetical protein